jgi:chaperonin GroES
VIANAHEKQGYSEFFRKKSLNYIMSSAVAKKFIPLLDRVLVQKIKQEAKTASGIFLPEQAKQVINQATVVAVGEGRILKDGQKIACSVKPGDSVIVPEFGGMTLKFDDEEYQVFRNEDIVGIMKSD